jgi:hypothetical protein
VLILLILAALIGLGIVIGMIQRPGVQARQKAYVNRLVAMAAQFGWQIDRGSAVNIYERLPEVNSVFGTDNAHGFSVGAQLNGHWRGVPIEALQLTYHRTAGMIQQLRTSTVLLMPRPVHGPDVVLTPQGMSWTNFLATDRRIGYPPFDGRFHVHARNDESARAVLVPALARSLAEDPRMADRVLFFGARHVAVAFPGYLGDGRVVGAAADLLADVVQSMAAAR